MKGKNGANNGLHIVSRMRLDNSIYGMWRSSFTPNFTPVIIPSKAALKWARHYNRKTRALPMIRGEWKLPDKNAIRRPVTTNFLRASEHNRLAICYYLIVEQMKGDRVANLSGDFRPLMPYWKQIVVLKRDREIDELTLGGGTVFEDFVDNEQTERLQECLVGGYEFTREVLTLTQSGVAFAEKCKQFRAEIDLMYWQELIISCLKKWPRAEVAKFNKGEDVSASFWFLLHNTIKAEARTWFDDNEPLPPYAVAVNSLRYRLAACVVLYALELANSGIERSTHALPLNPNLPNDFLDMNYASLGTLFDGIISNETAVNRVYERARFLLELARALPDQSEAT